MAEPRETIAGRFELIRLLGSGGMGEVHEAQDLQLKRRVAIKRMAPRLARIGETRARLLIEARSAARISHDGIATLYDAFEDGNELYLVMEFVDGETLRHHPTPLPVAQFLDIAMQAATALGAAHASDVVHGDIKPENLMLTPEGKLKVLDFGVAGITAPVSADDPTTIAAPAPPGSLGLTPSYAAPEILRGRPADQRADLFSLGLVFYELLGGKHPFAGATTTETAARILSEDPVPILEANADVPAELQHVLDKLLAKDPDDRYATAMALLEDLQRLRDGSGVSPGGLPRAPSGIMGKRAAMAAAAIILIVLGISTAPYWLPGVDSERRRVAVVDFDPTDWVIAVLPTVSGNDPDAEIEELNEGLAVALTAHLARLSREHGLQVIPSATLREMEIDTLESARVDLGVSLVINFETRRIGNRDLRVAATLVDVGAQRQLDADTIDGTAENLIELEEQVVLGVLRMLRVELEPVDRRTLDAGTKQPAAYELFLRGQGLMSDYLDPDNVDAGIDLFQRALRLDPNYARAHAALGTAFWRRYGETSEPVWIDRATQECRRAQELDDQEALAHICLGELYNGTGDPESAVVELSRALALDPTLDAAYIELGRVYEALNKPELAEATFRDAIATRPHYWSGHQWLGSHFLRRGRLDESIASFEEVVRLAPEGFSGYRDLGTAHYFAEHWDQARDLFERALDIRPDDQRTLSNLATLYFFQRRYTDAARTFERATQLDENNYFRWGNLADAYYWIDDERSKAAATYGRAVELAKTQLEVNPRDSFVLMDVAFFYAMLDQRDDATAHIERALELAPDDAFVLNQAAKVYYRLGDEERALDHLGAAIEAGYTVAEIRAEPVFDTLAGDPRFEALLNPGES